jgi:hypothetical protein
MGEHFHKAEPFLRRSVVNGNPLVTILLILQVQGNSIGLLQLSFWSKLVEQNIPMFP